MQIENEIYSGSVSLFKIILESLIPLLNTSSKNKSYDCLKIALMLARTCKPLYALIEPYLKKFIASDSDISTEVSLDDERRAAALGREIDAFIMSIKSYSSLDENQFQKVNEEIIEIFSKINYSPKTLQKNPYVRFLIQQCSRFNAYFKTYKINHSSEYIDGSNSKFSEINNKTSQNIYPIIMPSFLVKPILIEVTISRQSDSFRSVHVEKNEIPCYFYCQHDEKTFIPHYDSANKKIGLLTQQSNIHGFFKNTAKLLIPFKVGQDKDSYFKKETASKHQVSQIKYESLVQNIESGKPLTDEYHEFINGQNSFYTLPQLLPTEKNTPTVTHIGHATTLYQAGTFTLVSDPVHYQSATEGLAGIGAAIAYPRQTSPAIQTNRYPGVDVVWISHNHHDHLCPKSIGEAFPANTLFIVPVGDAKHFKKWGFYNVIEIKNWGESVCLQNPETNEILTIHSIPAKHASNRSLDDYMTSLYMGCVLEYCDANGKKSLTLISGDTGVLDDQHYQELEKFIQEKNTKVGIACIAAGPDRPRSLMECTHQSSLDAMVVHARLTVANLFNKPCSFEELRENSCHAIAYHQGCFRLGLLSFTDVPTTVLRVLATINSLQHCYDTHLTVEGLYFLLNKDNHAKTNIFYSMMDRFERNGLLQLLKQYSRIKISDNGVERQLFATELLQILRETFHLPTIGFSLNDQTIKLNSLNNRLDITGLLVNTNAKTSLEMSIKDSSKLIQFFESVCKTFTQASLAVSAKPAKFRQWLERPDILNLCNMYDQTSSEHAKREKLHFILCNLYQTVQGTERYDEELREEGNFETLILLIAKEKFFPEYNQENIEQFRNEGVSYGGFGS